MVEQKYPKGITFFTPRENAPTWVKGSLVISINQFKEWINSNQELLTEHEKYGKQIKLTITDKGLQVDTYKPQPKQYSVPESRKTANDVTNAKANASPNAQSNVGFVDDLPF